MDEILDTLKTVNLLIDNHLKQLSKLTKSLIPITSEFNKKDDIEPFNIILAASDIYYRENYHSDIIAYILMNKKNTIGHFINYINALSDFSDINVEDINTEKFLDTEIVREENRIDILIRDLSSKHCIIIENKINNAGDTERQLPKYYDKISKQGYVDRILYFSLDGIKRPETITWTEEDKINLKNKIAYGAASNESYIDFVHAFLVPCKNEAKDEQEKSFYCQYIDLLLYLGRNQMDYQLMGKFYEEMLNSEKYSSALSIRDMINGFIEYRRDRIHKEFLNKHEPFEKSFTWHDYAVFEWYSDIAPKELIKIDILPEENQTSLIFKIQDPKTKNDLIKTILQKIGEEKSFEKTKNNIYIKTFKFPDEEKILYEYLTKLFSLLNKHQVK